MQSHFVAACMLLKLLSHSLPLRPALTALLLLAALPAPAADDLVTLTPKPTTKPLFNPGKGWSVHDWPKWQDKEVLPFIRMGVRRFDWASLEPSEGQYDWTSVEETLDAWDAIGGVCNLGVMCANTHSKLPGGYVTPKWVFDAGAKMHELDLTPQMATQGTPGHKIAPVFDDPIFLAKYRAFLKAFAKRFDGDPRIAVLDIRSYGNWGECHMHPFKVPDISPEKFREHVQMHIDAFKKTQLCLSRNSHLGHFGPLKEVFDWAVLTQHIAPRRDGICGNSDGKETAIGLGIAPGVFEFYAGYDTLKQLGWWDGIKDKNGQGFRLEDCIENGHPTWVDLGGGKPTLRLLQENRALIERLTNRIGYHFILKEAKYPKTLTTSQPATLSLTWQNQGVAPIYIPAKVSFALITPEGKAAHICDATTSIPAAWKPDTTLTVADQLNFKDAPRGDYKLAIGLRQPQDTHKTSIQLGIELPTVDGWYVLGSVSVK